MSDATGQVIERLLATLDPLTRQQFGKPEQICLKRSLDRCGLSDIPEPVGEFERASGEYVCEICGQEYFAHPMDWRVIGHGDVPFLNILCNGRRVKL